jgi:hypothetical protein
MSLVDGRPLCPKAVTFLLGREARDGDVRNRPEAALDGVASSVVFSAACETASENMNIEETKIAATSAWIVLRVMFAFLWLLPTNPHTLAREPKRWLSFY